MFLVKRPSFVYNLNFYSNFILKKHFSDESSSKKCSTKLKDGPGLIDFIQLNTQDTQNNYKEKLKREVGDNQRLRK